MKGSIKKLISISLILLIGIIAVSSCAGDGDDSNPPTGNDGLYDNTYAFVAKDVQNPYMQKVYEGFDTACRELGRTSVYKAPEAPTAEKQIEIIKDLTASHVQGIAIAANDSDALTEALQEAIQDGIKVISLDSAVNYETRQTHIQQAAPEQIGRELIRTAYNIAGGQGGIAILTSTQNATNQNMWIDYMNREIAENPEKYASTPIVAVAYGDDDMMKSISEAQTLLQNPDIKVIISPTAIGICAAGQVIQDMKSDVKLTGLGMPSQMAEYIESGICPKMYLWNPGDVGYLAGYTLNALQGGQVTGGVGDIFNAGTLGDRTVTADAEGGTEVMLGDLLEFDKNNIGQWKDLF